MSHVFITSLRYGLLTPISIALQAVDPSRDQHWNLRFQKHLRQSGTMLTSGLRAPVAMTQQYSQARVLVRGRLQAHCNLVRLNDHVLDCHPISLEEIVILRSPRLIVEQFLQHIRNQLLVWSSGHLRWTWMVGLSCNHGLHIRGHHSWFFTNCFSLRMLSSQSFHALVAHSCRKASDNHRTSGAGVQWAWQLQCCRATRGLLVLTHQQRDRKHS